MAAEAAIFCTNCGVKNKQSSNFCFKCGTKVTKPDAEEKKEEKDEGDIIDISAYLGKEKMVTDDKTEWVKCGACDGGGWFGSQGACKESYSYKKCKCGCCDGTGKMPSDYKRCWRCDGQGNYQSNGLCHAGYQYKKVECPLCGGGCYFSSKKYDALRNNGTRNTKCETCKGMMVYP